VTAETGVLVRTLRTGGARVALCSSNPLSTQARVAAELRTQGLAVYARPAATREGYYADLRAVLDELAGRPDGAPAVLLDDGCDLIGTLHAERPELLGGGDVVPLAASEQTSSGVLRLRRLAGEGLLRLPVVALDASRTKRVVDTRWGSGQATVDALLRAAGVLLAGRTCVVAGYGEVGRGVCARLRGMGAAVVVTEVDPVAALEAALEGFRVLPMADAAPLADVLVTATGSVGVLGAEHLPLLRDGVVLANAGHFDVEIDVVALRRAAVRHVPRVRPALDAYELGDGRRVLLVAEGRVAGLAAAEGSPPEVMDIAFALQALVTAWLVETLRSGTPLPVDVLALPSGVDVRVAELALAARGTYTDRLTPDQEAYLQSWRSGS
jgi:adenosylhomocysteinase